MEKLETLEKKLEDGSITIEELDDTLLTAMPARVRNSSILYTTTTGAVYQIGDDGFIYKNGSPFRMEEGRDVLRFVGVVGFRNVLHTRWPPNIEEESNRYLLSHVAIGGEEGGYLDFLRNLKSWSYTGLIRKLAEIAIMQDKESYSKIHVGGSPITNFIPTDKFFGEVEVLVGDKMSKLENRKETSRREAPADILKDDILIGRFKFHRSGQREYSTLIRDVFDLDELRRIHTMWGAVGSRY